MKTLHKEQMDISTDDYVVSVCVVRQCKISLRVKSYSACSNSLVRGVWYGDDRDVLLYSAVVKLLQPTYPVPSLLPSQNFLSIPPFSPSSAKRLLLESNLRAL